MEIELTLVRITKTKEPVIATSYTGDIIELGRRIDEVTDPYGCEYKDVTVECSLQINWSDRAPNYKEMDELEKVDFIDHGSFPEGLCLSLLDEFEDDHGWTEMPEGGNYLVVGPTLDERFSGPRKSIEDVF